MDSNCCGIPIVCSECILERQKFTGADLDYYCSVDYFLQLRDKNIEVFLPLLELSFKVQPAWADSVMENGSFFVQVLFYVNK